MTRTEIKFARQFSVTTPRGSSVSIVTRLRAGRQRFDARQGEVFISFPSSHPNQLWGPSGLSNGYQESPSLNLMREQGREAEQSQFSAEL